MVHSTRLFRTTEGNKKVKTAIKVAKVHSSTDPIKSRQVWVGIQYLI